VTRPTASSDASRLRWAAPAAVVALVALAGACTWLVTRSRGFESVWEGLLFFLLRSLEAFIVVYAVAFVIASARYLALWRRPGPGDDPAPDSWPRAAVLYLCCGDIDETALESLSGLEYPGELLLLLHDDSTDPAERSRVDLAAARIGARAGVEWRVLRRPGHTGGKPGAVQWALEQTADEHDVFLLADNDSTAPDATVLRRGVATLERGGERLACVQFRNRRRAAANESRFARWVSASIDIFDAFTTGMFEPLWRPFVGHNAALRTRAVVEAGGFTPGVFADDLDLTVRLNVRGWRVEHRRDLEMQETHPTNYRSFCARAQKWATGCGQMLRMHLWRVLTSTKMTARQKLGFTLFSGFFLAQAATLVYATIVFIVLPPLTGAQWAASDIALAVGTIVPLTVFLPILAYLITAGARLPLLATLGSCAATYGSTDFWTALGLKRGLLPRGEARWTPTNSVGDGNRPILDWAHFGFGALFLIVPLVWQPALLAFPLTWLFAAKYLFVPAVAAHYAERPSAPGTTRAPARVSAGALAGAAAVWCAPLAVAQESATLPGFEPGEEVRGVQFTPWRPGTGPGRGFDYPSAELLREDFELIERLNANAVIAYDPPERMVAMADEYGLRVLYVFNIQWWRLPEGEGEQVIEEIASRAAELREQEAIFAWMLGNEVPGWVIDAQTPAVIREFLGEAREAIRATGDARPVCHGNWPLHRTLDLDRHMDLLTYNVYPFYPTEVPAMGYGNFIEQEIMPLADGRPALISEFGVNTIEVSAERQADVLVDCWRGLLGAGAQGGFVFSLADEWWKNYDNPIAPPDYWRRVEAPADHLTADDDPEEHFGVVDAEREPKPAFHAARAMFAMGAPEGSAPDGVRDAPMAGAPLSLWTVARWSIPTLFVALVLGAAVWARARAAREESTGQM